MYFAFNIFDRLLDFIGLAWVCYAVWKASRWFQPRWSQVRGWMKSR
jgi:hypothetical protein